MSLVALPFLRLLPRRIVQNDRPAEFDLPRLILFSMSVADPATLNALRGSLSLFDATFIIPAESILIPTQVWQDFADATSSHTFLPDEYADLYVAIRLLLNSAQAGPADTTRVPSSDYLRFARAVTLLSAEIRSLLEPAAPIEPAL